MVFLECVTIYFYGLPHALPLMLPYFYGSFVLWLLYALVYIFSEISTYLYHFQRFTMRYHQIFEKRIILIFFKKKLMVMRNNALEK